MIPIRDTIYSHSVPWVTRALCVAIIAAFVLELLNGHTLQGLFYNYGIVPANWLVRTPSDLLEWPHLFLSLLTSQFLHVGYVHLGFNTLYLYIFGASVEDRLGHTRFLLLYVGSGIASAVVHILTAPHSAIPMVGASGAIAGVLGAYLLLFPSARIVTALPIGLLWDVIDIPAFIFLGLWFLIQWWRGLLSIGQVADVGGIAFWAHIGGFLTGMAGVVLLHPVREHTRV